MHFNDDYITADVMYSLQSNELFGIFRMRNISNRAISCQSLLSKFYCQ